MTTLSLHQYHLPTTITTLSPSTISLYYHHYFTLSGRKPQYRDWLEKYQANAFLKKAQKSQRFKDIMVEKVGKIVVLVFISSFYWDIKCLDIMVER